MALNFEADIGSNTGYIKFLLKSALIFEAPLKPVMEKVVQVLLQKGSQLDTSVAILLSEFLEQRGEVKMAQNVLE